MLRPLPGFADRGPRASEPRSEVNSRPWTLTSLRTPCVLVDQARVERNIERMQDAVVASGKRLRPHAKTHQEPGLALTQIAAAPSACAAPSWRGRSLRRPSRPDIRIPYPLNPATAIGSSRFSIALTSLRRRPSRSRPRLVPRDAGGRA
jgi:hypothetical protein